MQDPRADQPLIQLVDARPSQFILQHERGTKQFKGIRILSWLLAEQALDLVMCLLDHERHRKQLKGNYLGYAITSLDRQACTACTQSWI